MFSLKWLGISDSALDAERLSPRWRTVVGWTTRCSAWSRRRAVAALDDDGTYSWGHRLGGHTTDTVPAWRELSLRRCPQPPARWRSQGSEAPDSHLATVQGSPRVVCSQTMSSTDPIVRPTAATGTSPVQLSTVSSRRPGDIRIPASTAFYEAPTAIHSRARLPERVGSPRPT